MPQTPNAAPDATTQPSDVPAADDAETPESPPDAPAAEDDDADETAEAELTVEELRTELEKARKRSIRYHQRMKAAEAKVTTLEGELATARSQPAPKPDTSADAERRAALAEAIAEAGIPFGVIKAIRAIEQADTPEARTAAIDQLRPHLASNRNGAHPPPTDPTSAPTLDQLIADAEQRQDVREIIRLKSQKLIASR